MKIEPWVGRVISCFPIFKAIPCCGCGKQFVFESGYKVKITETYRGYRFLGVCRSCAITIEDAYNLAVYGKKKIQFTACSPFAHKENNESAILEKQEPHIEQLFDEARRVAIEKGHLPMPFKKTNNTRAPFGTSCELCDSGMRIIPSAFSKKNMIKGSMYESDCPSTKSR